MPESGTYIPDPSSEVVTKYGQYSTLLHMVLEELEFLYDIAQRTEPGSYRAPRVIDYVKQAILEKESQNITSTITTPWNGLPTNPEITTMHLLMVGGEGVSMIWDAYDRLWKSDRFSPMPNTIMVKLGFSYIGPYSKLEHW